MNYAWLNTIKIGNDTELPVYKQIRDSLIRLIMNGSLQANVQLPSSRFLALHFKVHRNTIVAAMNELEMEGWITAKARKGLFVNEQLPLIIPTKYGRPSTSYPSITAFDIEIHKHLFRRKTNDSLSGFDDGFPDGRVAPVKELARAYTQTLMESVINKSLSRYTRLEGNILLREQLTLTMNRERGMPVKADNILITRGSQMSLYLTAMCLLKKDDYVIVTDPNFLTADYTFKTLGAKLIKVGIDHNGMLIDEVERACRHKKVRCLFVTSHHHHPTTVPLSVERRIRLLQLAEQYDFAIIEDDYDYDYHYANNPLLPIASNDRSGRVIYIGSFSKIISHVFRVGYVIAPKNLIDEMSSFRKIVDRNGDPVLEKSIGKMMENNAIKNNIRKSLNIYRQRRDDTAALLTKELGNYLTFEIPEGGLALWCKFNKRISLPDVGLTQLTHNNLQVSYNQFFMISSSMYGVTHIFL